MASKRRVAGAIRFLINARNLQLERPRVLHETLLLPAFIYATEKMLWKEKERSRIRMVQMDNLKGFLGIRRMDRVTNVLIRELCRVTKEADEMIDESASQWFGLLERIENARFARRVYVRECAGSR